MIWYDARTMEPVAPGAKEDGGEPSLSTYECWYCGRRTHVKFRKKVGICRMCNSLVLFQS